MPYFRAYILGLKTFARKGGVARADCRKELAFPAGIVT